MYPRAIHLSEMIKQKSHFLLGPRQTGKSSLLRILFPEARFFDLLESDTFRALSARPELLRQSVLPSDQVIVVDEVQKCPQLLDEVQLMLDRNKNLRFVLTGSSARKLKRGQANLLPGRVWTTHLYPLTHAEVPFELLTKRLAFGGLPGILSGENAKKELENYVGSYLKEEIQAEGLTRSVGNFARFLEVAGNMNAEQINFSSLSNDTAIPLRTVRDYFQILEDTLLAELLPVYQNTPKRKPVATPKCYFFDLGVANTLRKQLLEDPGPVESGKRWEHLIYCELRAYLSYRELNLPLTYWRTRTHLEVDFIVGDEVAIEVKFSSSVRKSDIRGLFALAEDHPQMRKIVVCNEPFARIEEGVEFMPLQKVLDELWSHQILSNS